MKIEKLCEECGNSYIAKTTVTKNCSNKCSRRAYKRRKRNEKLDLANKSIKTDHTKLMDARIERASKINTSKIDISGKEYLTVKQTCISLNMSKATVYRLFEKKILTKKKIGGKTLILQQEIKNILS